MKMNMRIAFAGASGTGKTTLAKIISQRFSLPVCPVGSRSVAQAMGFETPYDVDRAGRRTEFQRRLLEEKMLWEAEHEEFVTDRSVFDNLAYSTMHAPLEVDEAFIANCQRGMDRYTVVFHTPIDSFQHLGEDDARLNSTTYHRLYQSVLRGLISDSLENCPGVRPWSEVWVHETTLESRVDEVIAWLNRARERARED